MRLIAHTVIAAAVAIVTLGASSTISSGMECRDVCGAFFPRQSIANGGDDYDCQDAIDDTGGFCTNNGRLNLMKELPRGIDYRGGSYRSIYDRNYVYETPLTRYLDRHIR